LQAGNAGQPWSPWRCAWGRTAQRYDARRDGGGGGGAQEVKPKKRECLVSQHDRAGAVFNHVQGCEYQMVVTTFREGAHRSNPVARVLGLTVITPDGEPLPLVLEPTPKVHPLPLYPQALWSLLLMHTCSEGVSSALWWARATSGLY